MVCCAASLIPIVSEQRIRAVLACACSVSVLLTEQSDARRRMFRAWER